MPDISKQQIADSEALKAKKEQETKERLEAIQQQEEKQRKAQLLRIEYNLGLLDLGLDESMELQYRPEGIMPAIRLHNISPEEIAKEREFLQKYKADLTVMSGDAEPAKEPLLMGTDGEPIVYSKSES
jgi:hypothetical protein